MAAAVEAPCEQPSAASLSAARSAYGDALDAWMATRLAKALDLTVGFNALDGD